MVALPTSSPPFRHHFQAGEKKGTYRLLGQAVLSLQRCKETNSLDGVCVVPFLFHCQTDKYSQFTLLFQSNTLASSRQQHVDAGLAYSIMGFGGFSIPPSSPLTV